MKEEDILFEIEMGLKKLCGSIVVGFLLIQGDRYKEEIIPSVAFKLVDELFERVNGDGSL